MSINKLKLQILESVGNLDQPQSEQVLHYIRQLLRSRHDQEDYLNFKQRAIREIQNALGSQQERSGSIA